MDKNIDRKEFAKLMRTKAVGEHERLDNEPLLRNEKCDENCFEHCLEWLKQPVEDKDEN